MCTFQKAWNTHPAREVNAASEKPSSPQTPAAVTTNQTAWTGVCVRLSIRRQYLDPGRAPSRAKAKTTRDASTVCAAPVTNCLILDVRVGIMRRRAHLDNNDERPYGKHPFLAKDIKEELSHGKGQCCAKKVRDRGCCERRCDKEQPAQRCRCTHADQNSQGRRASSVCGFFTDVRCGVI